MAPLKRSKPSDTSLRRSNKRGYFQYAVRSSLYCHKVGLLLFCFCPYVGGSVLLLGLFNGCVGTAWRN